MSRWLRCTVLALAVAVAGDAGAADSRPNILLLVAEDMSARVGSFGDPVAVTPHIDALAARGVRYPNAFTTSGVCAPSRAALITGMHQNAIGAGHMRSHGWDQADYMAVPPPEVKAFPERLRRAGYFTYNVAKLDYQFSRVMPESGPSSIWDAESSRRYGVSWSDRPEGAPFFGMVTFMETHESALFPRDTWPRSFVHLVMAALQTILHWDSEEVVSPEAVSVPPYYPDTATVRKDIARHYDNIVTMDREVGAMLARLERDGLADDTIVIWTTDHGDGLPRAKRELFDSGTRVPMVIAWPEKYRPAGVEPGAIDERLISFVDLAPTILAMAGAPPPQPSHGRVFVGPGATEPRRYVFGARDRSDEVPDRQRAVRDARWRYIHNDHPETPGAADHAFRNHLDIMRELRSRFEQGELDGAQRTWFEPRPVHELYDTQADPFEIHDLAGDPAHVEELVRLQTALEDWQRRVPDLGALPEAELAERSWPGGVQPVTARPSFEVAAGKLEIKCPTAGASIEYRIDGGRWQLYSAPIAVEEGHGVEARAVRYGWAGSEIHRRESP